MPSKNTLQRPTKVSDSPAATATRDSAPLSPTNNPPAQQLISTTRWITLGIAVTALIAYNYLWPFILDTLGEKSRM